MPGPATRCVAQTNSLRARPTAGLATFFRAELRREHLRVTASSLEQQHARSASRPRIPHFPVIQRATGEFPGEAEHVPICTILARCHSWRCFQGSRGFATKRQRLDEYDSYEATVDPKRVPADFGRVPIHLQAAGELKETVTLAGRMRLANPNFWMRCSTAVKDLSGGFRAKELVSILNAYAKAGYRDAPLFHHLAQFIALQAHDCRASDLAVCLQAFARLGIRHESLFDILAWQCIRRIDELGPRGIATVAAAYGGVRHSHDGLFNNLAAHAEAQAETFCNIDLVQLLWGCARVGYRHSGLLERCADQLIHRVPTCTVLETLTAAEAFASLGFYRANLVSCLSEFFLCKIHSVPLRCLPTLLQTFTSFDKLLGPSGGPPGGPSALTANAALYRAALPTVARQAHCFSLSELAAVDSALRSVGLTHDLLARALQQLLPQQAPHLSPQECVEMLHQTAARCADEKDHAVAAAVGALFSTSDKLWALPDVSVLRLLEALKELKCLQALVVCASLVFGEEQGVGKKRRLGGAELLVAQRVLLEAFPLGGKFWRHAGKATSSDEIGHSRCISGRVEPQFTSCVPAQRHSLLRTATVGWRILGSRLTARSALQEWNMQQTRKSFAAKAKQINQVSPCSRRRLSMPPSPLPPLMLHQTL